MAYFKKLQGKSISSLTFFIIGYTLAAGCLGFGGGIWATNSPDTIFYFALACYIGCYFLIPSSRYSASNFLRLQFYSILVFGLSCLYGTLRMLVMYRADADTYNLALNLPKMWGWSLASSLGLLFLIYFAIKYSQLDWKNLRSKMEECKYFNYEKRLYYAAANHFPLSMGEHFREKPERAEPAFISIIKNQLLKFLPFLMIIVPVSPYLLRNVDNGYPRAILLTMGLIFFAWAMLYLALTFYAKWRTVLKIEKELGGPLKPVDDDPDPWTKERLETALNNSKNLRS